jgi:hypothetical protein
MKEISRISPVSFASIYAVMTAIMMLILGIFVYLLSLIGAGFGGVALGPFASFGIVAIILMPIMYGVIAFIFGLFSAWVYNGAARIVGGIKIELE